GERRFARAVLLLAILAQSIVLLWSWRTTLRFDRKPFMDVYVFQHDASRAVFAGRNPYAMTFPDIYGPNGNWVYAPELVRDGRVLFGFPYMPLTVLWDCLGQLVGDYRIAQLLAFLITAVCIAMIDGWRTGTLAALLLITTPRGLWIVNYG